MANNLLLAHYRIPSHFHCTVYFEELKRDRIYGRLSSCESPEGDGEELYTKAAERGQELTLQATEKWYHGLVRLYCVASLEIPQWSKTNVTDTSRLIVWLGIAASFGLVHSQESEVASPALKYTITEVRRSSLVEIKVIGLVVKTSRGSP
ncbi:hypothetical protein AOLI_G00191740 [Acnodon oligacanthus]